MSLYLQMWIVSENLPKEMDRSKQRIFEILIFTDLVCNNFKNGYYLKNFLLKTDRIFLIIDLEQGFDQNHFKCEFYKKSP